ncbi:Calponin-3 [Lamellibrachia satsuma]|nr:Calponin-3 [Lamellibrachia satsuma]
MYRGIALLTFTEVLRPWDCALNNHRGVDSTLCTDMLCVQRRTSVRRPESMSAAPQYSTNYSDSSMPKKISAVCRDFRRAPFESASEASVPESEALGMDRFHAALKDGILLCKLADAIIGPGKVKFNKMKVPFKQMENINFLVACEKYGVAKTDLFQTVDLFENQNLWQVVCKIHAFRRKAQTIGFQSPCPGPREAAKNVREFTEDQLQAGQTVIGLQMGTNEVASLPERHVIRQHAPHRRHPL